MPSLKITATDVQFRYQHRVILRDVNLRLPANQIIAITGPSGTGKSTLLQLFNRLWEENGGGRFTGTISMQLQGEEVDIYRGISLHRLRRLVGMVFQTPNPLPMSIFKNVAFPLQLSGKFSNTEISRQVMEMLARVHLFDEVKDRLSADCRTLSGGQQQRLCLARALVLQPEVLLLDEPTSSLDQKACEKLEELIVELKRDCTILLVSHYQDQVQRVADQVYHLHDASLTRV